MRVAWYYVKLIAGNNIKISWYNSKVVWITAQFNQLPQNVEESIYFTLNWRAIYIKYIGKFIVEKGNSIPRFLSPIHNISHEFLSIFFLVKIIWLFPCELLGKRKKSTHCFCHRSSFFFVMWATWIQTISYLSLLNSPNNALLLLRLPSPLTLTESILRVISKSGI